MSPLDPGAAAERRVSLEDACLKHRIEVLKSLDMLLVVLILTTILTAPVAVIAAWRWML